jgi:hypothetical protein
MSVLSIKYKYSCLDAVCVRLYLCWITVQQMQRLLRKTNISSRRREDSISKHINCLGTNTNLIMGPDGDKNYCAGEDL